jgi:hypothetical protein
MAKLVKLCQNVDIPQDDKNHFFEDFGEVVKQLLSVKEFTTFAVCMQAFMQWASSTELEDLNFMVPEDPIVQSCLSSFMNDNKCDLGPNN